MESSCVRSCCSDRSEALRQTESILARLDRIVSIIVEMEPESSDIPSDFALRGWLDRKKAKPRLSLGVSIRDLHVHGFISSTRVQSTVVSYALAIPKLLVKLFSHHSAEKVQILRDINGVVRGGEMLLVLGRPGSGCTTFLKALAGDTHGIFISEKSTVNYEGEYFEKRDLKIIPLQWKQDLVPANSLIDRNLIFKDATRLQRGEHIPRGA